MRIHARLLLGMFGLALAVPAVAVAAPFGDDERERYAGGPDGQPQPQPSRPTIIKGCSAGATASSVNVPMSRPTTAWMFRLPRRSRPVMQGRWCTDRSMAGQAGSCPTCQGNVVVTGPVMTADAHAPGYAVVGGPGAMASADAPGYAVVGEAARGPRSGPDRRLQVGPGALRRSPHGRDGRSSGRRWTLRSLGRPHGHTAGSGRDARSRAHNRPHIIATCWESRSSGSRRRAEEDKERQKHAAIAYDQPDAKVTELPASMVYGKGDH